jgi:spore germination protein GerM
VPYGLLEPATSTSTTQAPSDGAVLYLVSQGGLAPVRRPVRSSVSVRIVVEALGQDPPPEEEAQGLRSVLAAGEFVLGARASSGVGRIDLAEGFRSLPEREQTLALAQLVLTTTEVEGIDRVAFTLEGEPLDVPTADGTLRSGSVTRADYQSLLLSPS